MSLPRPRPGLAAVVVMVVALVVAPATAGVTAATASATAQQEPTRIDSCTTITEPGRYVLTADIRNSTTDACIDVRASDVVLDGRGHTVDGVQTDSDLAAYVNATFTNGTTPAAPEWANFGVAVRNAAPGEDADAATDRPTNVTVRDVTATDWTYGVATLNATGVAVRNVTATHNGEGVELFNSTASTAADVTAERNAIGVVLFESNESTVTGVTARDNLVDGVEVVNGTDNVVRDSTATGNEFDGIYLQDAAGTVVSNSTASDNREAGLLAVDATDSEILGNTLTANDLTGLTFINSDGNLAAENTVSNTLGTVAAAPTDPTAVGFINSSTNLVLDTDARNNRNWTVYSLENSTNTVRNLSLSTGTVSFDARDAAVAAARAPNVPENRAVVGPALRTAGTSENAYLDLRVGYDDRDVAELGVDERAVRLWRSDGRWTPVPGRRVLDTDANVVGANLTEFGVVAPLAPQRGPADRPADRAAEGPFGPSFAVDIGPPRDLNDDGLYEDVTGDGRLNEQDVAALAALELTTEQTNLRLTPAQVAALDFDGDGRLDADDAAVLATEVALGGN